MTTPSTIFTERLSHDGYAPHPAQIEALKTFDYLQKIILTEAKPKSLATLIFNKFKLKEKKCIYCFGEVGQGKSLMLDSFAAAMPDNFILRKHFHTFMLDIHKQLNNIKHANPINVVAKNIASQCKVLCLDEFIVDNIVDAMLLGKLIVALQTAGVAILTNGNTAPDDLYKGGLQRDLFAGTIQLIKQTFVILHLQTKQDYRQLQTELPNLFIGDIKAGNKFILKHWQLICTGLTRKDTHINLYDRNIPVIAVCASAIWLDFTILCSPPRAAKDYIYLCDNYEYIIISGVKTLTRDANDLMYNWIKFIDICYDTKIKIIIAAEVALDNIYTGSAQVVKQARCISRLNELLSGKNI
jgi:cell division protein ZapE